MAKMIKRNIKDEFADNEVYKLLEKIIPKEKLDVYKQRGRERREKEERNKRFKKRGRYNAI